MEPIRVDSSEYRAFAAAAIASNDITILQQLKEARATGKPYIRLIGSFYDDLRNTGTTVTDEEQEERAELEYIIITGKDYYSFLQRDSE